MTKAPTTLDVVNRILGIGEASTVARLRSVKPNQIDELQNYYLALFEPTSASAEAFPVADRCLVAIRVASFTKSIAVADWYAGLATDAGVSMAVIERARDVGTPWSDASRLGAAMRHADLIVTRPADARKEDIDELKRAGFNPAGILSLSQVIAFVSYQLRLIAGLRAFGATS